MEAQVDKELALDKVKKIKTGYSAFTESKKAAEFIKDELEKEGIQVTEDTSESGSWFIPVNKRD